MASAASANANLLTEVGRMFEPRFEAVEERLNVAETGIDELWQANRDLRGRLEAVEERSLLPRLLVSPLIVSGFLM